MSEEMRLMKEKQLESHKLFKQNYEQLEKHKKDKIKANNNKGKIN